MPTRARATVMASITLAAVSAVVSGSLAPQSPLHRSTIQGKPMSPEGRQAVRQAARAVGLILVRNSEDPPVLGPRPRGSAVVLSRDGLLVTNFHVIALDNSSRLYDEILFNLPADGVSALSASRRYRLKVVLTNKDLDLALLRVVSDSEGRDVPADFALPRIELGDSHAVQLLDDIIVIGFPEKGGSTVTVNPGVVEGKDGNWIRCDARLIHGNSGGAAVNTEGKLIGIPTKVVVDERLIDEDSRRRTELINNSVAVGFLRPAHLVAAMVAQLDDSGKNPNRPASPVDLGGSPWQPANVIVRGVVRSATAKPIAGALAGIIPRGAFDVTAANLVAWGGTNADGEFEMNRPVAPGRYTMKVRAMGYEDSVLDVEITEKGAPIIVELRQKP